MSDVDPTAVAGGGGVIGSAVTLAGLWLKGRFLGERTAENAHREIDTIKERLTRIEEQIDAVRVDNQRNESGIKELGSKLDTMNQAATAAQIELATTLGRIEGELRARRKE